MDRNKVVLVDENDNPLGEMAKLEAHQKGVLHRAFSVFLFNANGEMLIHQRALDKYHGAGLWTNACCSHPQWGEDIEKSAVDRLVFEMGLHCNIQKAFNFIYHAPVENNLIEHEFDHVYIGHTDAIPIPNKMEVRDYRWIDTNILLKETVLQPDKFTFWFRNSLAQVIDIVGMKKLINNNFSA